MKQKKIERKGETEMKQKKIETEEWLLPSHWACALINDDRTGLDDDEEKELEAFLEREKPGWCSGVGEETGFRWIHDASPWVRGCDCSEFTFAKL